MSDTKKIKLQNIADPKVIFEKGNKLVNNYFIAFFLPSTQFSCFIIASKKIGNSVKRNKAKRRLRETIRLQIVQEQTKFAIVLLARNATHSGSFEDLNSNFQKLASKITSIT